MNSNQKHEDNGSSKKHPADLQQSELSAKESLLARLREITPEQFDAWKEEIRQSRLHDWEDDDDDVNLKAATESEQQEDGPVEY